MNYQNIRCSCKYKEVFDNNHIPMLIINPELGSIEDANSAACIYYGYIKEQLISMAIDEINVLTQEEKNKEINNAIIEDKKFLKHRHKLSNGEIRDVEVYNRPIEIEDKQLILSVIIDIREKTELEKENDLNKAYFDSLFINSPEAIAIVDNDFRVQNINEKFEKVFQYKLEEIKHEDLTKLLCEQTLYDTSYNFRDSIIRGKFVKEEVRRKRKDGKMLDVLLLGFPLVVKGKTIGAYCIYSDISEVKEKEKQIQLLTSYDTLTGFYNRSSFLENIGYEIRNSKADLSNKDKMAVLLINIKEFKEINEALGHTFGDKVLLEFALMLRKSVNSQYTLARLRDAEFAILLSKIKDLQELKEIVDDTIKKLNTIFTIENIDLKISLSMGMAMFPDDGCDSITLIRKAEIAMNKSKELNSNTVMVYENSLDAKVQDYFWTKNDLAKAISNDEFILNYQPIYETDTNNLVGVEALIRWNHKEKGIVPPLKFISIAEQAGMINSIGEWVLLNACKQNKAWQDMGYKPIYVSVNVSVLQLEQPDFYKLVRKVLKESKLEPRYLQLEITESIFTQNYVLIEGTIRKLNELGIKLTIDDFGTGYSSLGQLCELDINNIKIDRSFIKGVNENTNKSKVVKAVISLAKSLNISLTAEGVETQEQLNFLRENRCTMVQGYLFGKPMKTAEIERLLE